MRVLKSSAEFIRCEAEIENKSSFKHILAKVDNTVLRGGGSADSSAPASISDLLKVRAAEAKLVYPNRYDWESFFREDGGGADVPIEMKRPGERPDTVHISDLPCRWFAAEKRAQQQQQQHAGGGGGDPNALRPSESVVREVFSIFGEIRLIDLIMPEQRRHGNEYAQQISLGGGVSMPTFEAFVQYKDYISFVKCMDTFRGMKMLFVDVESRLAYTANVKVEFDKTKHLSDKEIQRRKIEGFKNIEIEKIKSAQQEKDKDKEAKQREIAKWVKAALRLLSHRNRQTNLINFYFVCA